MISCFNFVLFLFDNMDKGQPFKGSNTGTRVLKIASGIRTINRRAVSQPLFKIPCHVKESTHSLPLFQGKMVIG